MAKKTRIILGNLFSLNEHVTRCSGIIGKNEKMTFKCQKIAKNLQFEYRFLLVNAAYLKFNAASILENALYYKLLRLAEKIWRLKNQPK